MVGLCESLSTPSPYSIFLELISVGFLSLICERAKAGERQGCGEKPSLFHHIHIRLSHPMLVADQDGCLFPKGQVEDTVACFCK